MNLCEIVRRGIHADILFCLYPHRQYEGLTQACTVAYSPAITIDLRFFEQWVQVWVGEDEVRYLPSNRVRDCFHIEDFVRELYLENQEIALWLTYSIFLKALRQLRVDPFSLTDVYNAVDDADDAAHGITAYSIVDISVYGDEYACMKRAFKKLIKFRKQVSRKNKR